jgi:hypothetical protein
VGKRNHPESEEEGKGEDNGETGRTLSRKTKRKASPELSWCAGACNLADVFPYRQKFVADIGCTIVHLFFDSLTVANLLYSSQTVKQQAKAIDHERTN